MTRALLAALAMSCVVLAADETPQKSPAAESGEVRPPAENDSRGVDAGTSPAEPDPGSLGETAAASREATPGSGPATAAPALDRDALLRTLEDALEKIETEYVRPVDHQRLAAAAMKAMLRELDPHSSYVGPDELTRFQNGVSNEFVGVGLNLIQRDGRLLVVAAIPGSPAAEARLSAGDELLEIAGAAAKTLSLDEAVELLAGGAAPTTSLQVLRAGAAEPERLNLPKRKVQAPTVLGRRGDWTAPRGLWGDEAKQIGYLRISTFSPRTSGEFREAVTHLLTANAKGLILDLRGNPGGFMEAAVEVADLFVDQGVLVSAEGRNYPRQEWHAHEIGTVRHLPLAVLVNRDSASASEIVAACLQDHQRAVVVGERTYGKGTVQSIFPLGSGRSALKLTTAHYHRPSATGSADGSPAAWAVQPNLVVEFSAEERRQLESVFARQLAHDADAEPSAFVDRQLLKAIDWLESQPSASADSMPELQPETTTEPPMDQSRLVRSDMRGASS